MKRTPLPKSNALVLENGMLKLAPPGSTIQKPTHKSEPQLNIREGENDAAAAAAVPPSETTSSSPIRNAEQVIQAVVQDIQQQDMPFYQNLCQVNNGGFSTTSTTLHQSHENIYTDLSGPPYALYTPENIYPHLMPQNFMQAQKRRMPRSSSGGSVLV